MTSRLKLAVLAAALILGLSAGSAQAGPISGSFSISGNFLPVNAAGDIVSLDAAAGLDFIDLWGSDSTFGIPGEFFVNSAKGDFVGLAGQTGFIQDLIFAGSYPIAPFQSVLGVAGFTFDLFSAAVSLQTTDFLLLNGTGMFHKTGFLDTPGLFKFSANGADGTFSFSASESTTVPEPASLLLIGTGLAMGAARLRGRSKRQAAS
jgi:hypothetical protein